MQTPKDTSGKRVAIIAPRRSRRLADLASARVGGRAIATNDDFFAPKSNLVKPEPAIFIPGKFTTRGKWMDGWESRRRRTPGHDWCVVELGMRGSDPRRQRGHELLHRQLPVALLDRGARHDPRRDQAALRASEGRALESPLLAQHGRSAATATTTLTSNARRSWPIEPWTHVRLNIFPDGGVARLRVLRRGRGGLDARSRRSAAADRSRRDQERRPGARRERHALRREGQHDHAGPRAEHGRRVGDDAAGADPDTTGRSCGSAPPERSAGSRSTPTTSRATTRTARRSRVASRRAPRSSRARGRPTGTSSCPRRSSRPHHRHFFTQRAAAASDRFLTCASTSFRMAASAVCVCMEPWRRLDAATADEARAICCARAADRARWIERMMAQTALWRKRCADCGRA